MYMYIRPSVLLPLPSCPCWLFSLFLQLKGFQWRLFFISFFNLCLDFRLANHFELRLVFLSVPIGGWLHLTAKRKNKNRTCYQCTFTPSCFSCFWFVPSPQLQNTQVSRTKTFKKTTDRRERVRFDVVTRWWSGFMLWLAPARVTISRRENVWKTIKKWSNLLRVNCLHFFAHRFAISLSID